ncbi:putative b-zip transcription factor idi-4 protein [Rosellinia necatrix]|uniref:Putative b-zip transcription factor idi-4 protein n=1 Tax=Rosellinia necatrix TaxID=77044 RepID=A0A1S7UK62_ROSNE|nr:putative b-zip transcription factor idi-4 protein [Rosellinia necatrix]
MPSATSMPASQPDPYSMSPPSIHYDQAPLATSGKRRTPPVDHVTALKRQRNNVAARKYRQKRIDRINELELELDEVKQERDDLKIRLARQEAEAAALRTMLQMKSGEGQKS